MHACVTQPAARERVLCARPRAKHLAGVCTPPAWHALLRVRTFWPFRSQVRPLPPPPRSLPGPPGRAPPQRLALDAKRIHVSPDFPAGVRPGFSSHCHKPPRSQRLGLSVGKLRQNSSTRKPLGQARPQSGARGRRPRPATQACAVFDRSLLSPEPWCLHARTHPSP